MRADNRIRYFAPRQVARYEKDNYVAYYQKDWLRLLRVSIALVKHSFGLSWLQAVYGAYLVARGEMAFAPFPQNDVPGAEAFMRRFYQFIQGVHGADFDAARAAQLEVNWWSVHRKLFGNPQNAELVDAVQQLYSEAYGISPAKARDSATLRAKGMLYSDLWVNAGKRSGDPLLAQEETALYESYVALKQAISE
jgi:hypothetical protein